MSAQALQRLHHVSAKPGSVIAQAKGYFGIKR
jgi:hypothetical protein